MNESYTSFAQVYDMFMDNVDYPAWSKYLIQLLKEYQVEDGLVLDLGCGTGNMTELLAKEGYDMIGVDNSEDMLEIASEKRAESGLNILYLLQDMREFELYGTVKAVVSICDSINYILEEDDLREVFSLVNNYLDPKGMFIFDLNTEYKYRKTARRQASSGTITMTRRKRSTNMSLPFSSRREKIPICTANLKRYIIRERTILRRSAAYWKRQAWSLWRPTMHSQRMRRDRRANVFMS